MQILILLLRALLFYLLYPLYKERVQKILNAKSLNAFFTFIKKAGTYISNQIRIYFMRSESYAVFQNIQPYELAVRDLNVCKYFKYAQTADIGRDILEIQFRIIGISSQYQSCLKELSLLLAQLLNDFYMERLGILTPYIYVALLQEGELKFWVAKNRYGNVLIQKRSAADEWKDMPNTKDLKDD